MRVFVAGATGALGRPLVRQLIARGHSVVGMTRSTSRADVISRLGGEPIVADALDARAVKEAMREARPDTVVHALTALPASGPKRLRDLRQTNVLRTHGTENLLNASRAAGVARFVAQSMILVYGPHQEPRAIESFAREQSADAFAPTMRVREVIRQAMDALKKLEDDVAAAAAHGIAGVTLRYGLFYGPGTTSDFMARQLRRRQFALPRGDLGQWSWIHVEDAAAATLRAIESAGASTVYNVVDDDPVAIDTLVQELARVLGARAPWRVPPRFAAAVAPFPSAMANISLCASNRLSRSDLGWEPRFPTHCDGLRPSYGFQK